MSTTTLADLEQIVSALNDEVKDIYLLGNPYTGMGCLFRDQNGRKVTVIDSCLFEYFEKQIETLSPYFKSGKTEFVVYNGELCAIRKEQPTMIQSLSGVDSMLVPVFGEGMRKATREDFNTFRVSSKGFENDPRCNFPAI